MTLITGSTAITVGDEIYAYSNRVDFSAFASGAEATALDFTSPNDFFRCIINISLDSGSWAADDIIAIIIRGNGENLAQYKWTVNATTIGSPQTIFPLSVILPPNTVFRVVFAMSSSTAMVGSAGAVLVGKKIGGSLG